MIDLDRLAALAEAATPGPWVSVRCETPGYRHVAFSRKHDEPYTIGPALPTDTAYIAAMSPDVALALIARARELDRFYEFVNGCDPAIVDAYLFTENNRLRGHYAQPDAAPGTGKP